MDSHFSVSAIDGSPRALSVGKTGETHVPHYLERTYWWAYVHPRAVRFFEREWLVNLILFGNYHRLCDEVLGELGETIEGNVLQVACVYGNLTLRLQKNLGPRAGLDVVDVLPIQLRNLENKLLPDDRIRMIQADSSSLPLPSGSYDHVILYFLLHEQPDSVRRATVSEAIRVTKPGGKVVIVDYHEPSRLHPSRALLKMVFRWLEPFASELWDKQITNFMPKYIDASCVVKNTYFGGLYQKVVLKC